MRRDLATALLALLLSCREAKQEAPPNVMIAEPQTTDTAAALAECERRSAAQKQALANDSLTASETFAKYPAQERLRGAPASVDITSERYARVFRTKLREEVAAHGVNFAGAYSLVSVGMTGWGDNWYLVDRRTGKVTLFPYYAAYLDFRKDSDLIVMNARERIEQAMRENDGPDCFYLGQQEFTTLRPVYFLWRDGKLTKIGPEGFEPPRNRFWDEYLRSAAEGGGAPPNHVSYQIRTRSSGFT